MSAEEFLLLDEEEGDKELHVDERWLVSYSDMMTLLFGLFVLLYAMYDRVDIIQDSMKDKFGVQKEAPAAKAGANAELLNSLKKARLDLQYKALDLQAKTETLEAKNRDLKKEVANLKNQLAEADRSVTQTNQKLEDATRVFNSRDKENAPEAGEPVADLRSDGLGGRGTQSGGSHQQFHVKVTLPDGSVIEQDAHIGKNGFMLSEAPSVSSKDRLSVEISNGDQTVYVQARAVLDDSGQTSNRIKFMNFDGNGEATLREWQKGH